MVSDTCGQSDVDSRTGNAPAERLGDVALVPTLDVAVFREIAPRTPGMKPLAARPYHSQRTLGDAFSSRDNNIVVLRLLLAIIVVYSHSFPLTLGPGRGDPLSRLTAAGGSGTGVGSGAGLTSGYFAVCGFFVLSGFVITHSFLRARSLRAFAFNRARRIYPAFLLAGIACFALLAPLAMSVPATQLLGQFPAYATDLLMLRSPHIDGLFPNNPFPGVLNGSIWSIKYEFVCYAMVATLGTLGLLRRPRLIVGLFFVATALYALQVGGAITLWWPRHVARFMGEIDQWPRILTYHLAGMSLYLHRHRVPRRGWMAIVGVALMVAIGAISPAVLYVAMPMLAGYAALYVALGATARRFTRGLDKLDLSYGVYLYAFPIQQCLVQSLPTLRGQPMLLFAMSLPLVLLAALVSKRLLSPRAATAAERVPSMMTAPARLAA